MPHSTANDRTIAEIVARLLNHFGTVDEPAAVRKALAEDWLEDLREFTPAQLQWAASEWRRTQSLRPAIAEIRALATHAQHRELEAKAISGPREPDADTLRLYAAAEYHGDIRTPMQRRDAAIAQSEEKFRRAAAYRAGKLDEYDALHHPERLAAHRAAQPEPSLTARDLGVSASERAAE